MFEFIIGFIACYAIGTFQVYRERQEHFTRSGLSGNPAAIALKWPLAIGPKW